MNDEKRDPGYPFGQRDAMKWVEEFDRLFPDRRPDNGTMLGWFANAIETGVMHGSRPEADLRGAGLDVEHD